MRGKYRSAVYVYNDAQFAQALTILNSLKTEFSEAIVTQVYAFKTFKHNKVELQNYFYSAPQRPFCQTYIQPKLKLLLSRFNHHADQHKMAESGLDLNNI
jgi:peptide-methionine (S)-S-oxide reductase